MSEKVLRISRILIHKKRGVDAIPYLYSGIQQDPNNPELYLELGNALKQSLEYQVALKIYHKALQLAPQQENLGLIQKITDKIENFYLLGVEDVLEGPQIGFFIRSIMKMVSQLGKKDWF
jgi:tetratricopeptide (TPR) repeat protein